MHPCLFTLPCFCSAINVGRFLVPHRADPFSHIRIRPILSCSGCGSFAKEKRLGGQLQEMGGWGKLGSEAEWSCSPEV